MTDQTRQDEHAMEIARRRRKAMKTVIVLALVAVAFYASVWYSVIYLK